MPHRLTMLLTVAFCVAVSTMPRRSGRPDRTANGRRQAANSKERAVKPTTSNELNPEDARKLLTQTRLGGIDNGLLFYALDKDGDLPKGKGATILEALTRKNDLNEDGIFDKPWITDHKDAWGRPFLYEWPTKKWPNAKKPAVWSRGPNGIDEGGRGDDVRNWK